jgi:uncharacterized protein YdeI (YjbR/CyaY-like superfamily)
MAKSSIATSSHQSSATNPTVDWYFSKNERWEKAIRKLRTIGLACQLTEELKWGCPCYTLNGAKIVLIHVFKEYCALLFFKGALLKDEHGILIQQTKNVQAARQIRFTNSRDVATLQRVVKAYILEAIEVEKSGLQVEMKKTAAFEIPDEFKIKLQALPTLKKAFYALTPGRQRGYLLHFSSAKQRNTREARIEKCMARILGGKGLND